MDDSELKLIVDILIDINEERYWDCKSEKGGRDLKIRKQLYDLSRLKDHIEGRP